MNAFHAFADRVDPEHASPGGSDQGTQENISKVHEKCHTGHRLSAIRMSNDGKQSFDSAGKPASKVKESKSQATSDSGSSQTVESAIKKQNSPPVMYVGPLSPKRKVPFYQRQRGRCYSSQANPSTSDGDGNQGGQGRNKCRALKRSEQFALGRRYLPRLWELTEFGKHYERRPSAHRGFDFTVMSYNVLAQELLDDHYDLYNGCRTHHLEWGFRWKLILDELKYHNPDIICLQEVNKDHYNSYFRSHLEPLGYEGNFMSRTGDKRDGCATFYRVSKFTLEKCIPVNYHNPDGGTVLDRDNVALIVKLKPKSRSLPRSRRLCVANTHLLYNPRRGDIKLAQLMILLAELDKHGFVEGSGYYRHHGMIVCGDFNSVPYCPLYELVVHGHLLYTGIPRGLISGQEKYWQVKKSAQMAANFLPTKVGITDHCQYVQVENERIQSSDDVAVASTQGSGSLLHDLRLVSVYEHYVSRLDRHSQEATTWQVEPSTVDYIFYNVLTSQAGCYVRSSTMSDIEEAQLQLIGRFGLISQREFYQQGPIPNNKLGSDHLSITAKFALR